MKQRWFEQDHWNKDIEAMFFKKISRSKKECASQYIRIQAILFLLRPDRKLNEIAIRLINYLFYNYPDNYMDIMFCHEALAEFYYFKGEFQKSYSHYEIIRQYNKSSQSAKYCTITSELGLIKNILQMNEPSKLQYATDLIIEIYPYINNNFGFFKKLRNEYVNVCIQLYEKTRDNSILEIIKLCNT